MKSNLKMIIITIAAILIGFGAGYLIFGTATDSSLLKNAHDHNEELATVSDDGAIWTCSMHPQIRQNEPGDCPLCGMDLIPLEENKSDDPLVLKMTPEAVKLANIQTTIIGANTGNSAKIIRLSGKIQADERLASSQVAHVPGRIEKLFVSFTGEQVNKGQKIALLYSPELITAQRELLEALKLQALNPSLVEAARNKLRYWKIENSEIERIEQSRIIQETFTVYADESGIVTNRRVSVGDYVKQGESLFALMNLRKVWILFDAYEENLATIKVGDKIEFTTPSIANKTFETRVTFIDPVIDPVTRVASIRTEVQNPNGSLKPEMLVYGILRKTYNAASVTTVPKSAVLWTGTRSVVYVKVPDMAIPSFQFREVEIGDEQGDNYQILNGLEFGEEVVTYGSFTIDAAAQLNNQASMMNRNVLVKEINQSSYLPDYTENTPLIFKGQLFNLATTYLNLKDALVATNGEAAKEAARQILSSLSEVDVSLLKKDARNYWITQRSAIEAHSETIAASPDIEKQRKQFDFLSQVFIKSVKVFGIGEATLYVQHCPMANDNEGADWLSDVEEIRNPYFGDVMLACGIVKTIIDANFKNPPAPKVIKTQQSVHKH